MKAGNRTAELVGSLLLLCQKHNVHFLIEQPSSSLLFVHPHMRGALDAIPGVQQVSFQMNKFGAPSAKPTTLVGNCPWIHKIKEAATQTVFQTPVQKLARVDEAGRVTGKRDALQASAAYPQGFCNLIAACLLQHLHARYVLKRLCVEPLWANMACYEHRTKVVSQIMLCI